MEDPLVLPAIVEGTESKTGSSFDSESKAGAEGFSFPPLPSALQLQRAQDEKVDAVRASHKATLGRRGTAIYMGSLGRRQTAFAVGDGGGGGGDDARDDSITGSSDLGFVHRMDAGRHRLWVNLDAQHLIGMDGDAHDHLGTEREGRKVSSTMAISRGFENAKNEVALDEIVVDHSERAPDGQVCLYFRDRDMLDRAVAYVESEKQKQLAQHVHDKCEQPVCVEARLLENARQGVGGATGGTGGKGGGLFAWRRGTLFPEVQVPKYDTSYENPFEQSGGGGGGKYDEDETEEGEEEVSCSSMCVCVCACEGELQKHVEGKVGVCVM
jgi:hypothetical protein